MCKRLLPEPQLGRVATVVVCPLGSTCLGSTPLLFYVLEIMPILLSRFIYILVLWAVMVSAHAQIATGSTNAAPTDSAEVAEVIDEAAIKHEAGAKNIDPWQGYNRSMFTFNIKVDRLLLKPIAKAYVRLTPSFFRQGVSNVFFNVLEVPSALNALLQGKPSAAAQNGGRILVNTTLGLAGLFDVAQHMGLPRKDGEDFGQTLGVWGLEPGRYVVLPFLGPSNLRDAFALPVDWYTDPKTYIDHVRTSNTTKATSFVDTRAGYLPLEKAASGDKYVFYRDAYLQRRYFLVNDGVVEDSFGADESDEGEYGY
jgi:phospholipid-binding lipoprotein MlaA